MPTRTTTLDLIAATLAVVVCLMPAPTVARGQDACTIGAFRAGFNHRIPADAWIVYDAATDPASRLGRPGFYTAKANWTDGRFAPDADGGYAAEFPDVATRERWEAYLHAFDGTMFSAGYIYGRNTMLTVLSQRYTPDQADELASILAESCP